MYENWGKRVSGRMENILTISLTSVSKFEIFPSTNNSQKLVKTIQKVSTMSSVSISNDKASINFWLDWFKSRDSVKVINQSNLENIFVTFAASVEKLECIDKVLKHEEFAYLQKASFGEGMVTVFHHLKSVDGSLYGSGGK